MIVRTLFHHHCYLKAGNWRRSISQTQLKIAFARLSPSILLLFFSINSSPFVLFPHLICILPAVLEKGNVMVWRKARGKAIEDSSLADKSTTTSVAKAADRLSLAWHAEWMIQCDTHCVTGFVRDTVWHCGLLVQLQIQSSIQIWPWSFCWVCGRDIFKNLTVASGEDSYVKRSGLVLVRKFELKP